MTTRAVVHDRTQGFSDDMRRRLGRILNQVSIEGVSHMRRGMALPKTGKMPPAGLTRAQHRRFKTRRSAPGEMPAIQTSHLQTSLGWYAPEQLVRRVGTTLEKNVEGYALRLEFGQGRMAARPYMRPALEHMRPILKRRTGGIFR